MIFYYYYYYYYYYYHHHSMQGFPTSITWWSDYYYFHFIQVFHTSFNWWLFHWCLTESKSPQVSRTLLSILTDFNNAVVWIVSILPLISSSSNIFQSILGPFQVHQLQFVSPSLLCSIVSSAPWKDPHICLSFHFLSSSLHSSLNGKIHEITNSFLLVN